MTAVPLRCECGQVRGVAKDISPEVGTRVVCYCRDCQAFARFLGQPGIVDEHGGTDIFQMPPSLVSITHGAEQLACVRLSDKGLFRWFAACCRTPIGNTVGPRVPFVGLIHSIMRVDDVGRPRDEILGKAVVLQTASARGTPPRSSVPAQIWLMARIMLNLAGWWVRGRGYPSPFFEKSGTARGPVRVLSPNERKAL